MSSFSITKHREEEEDEKKRDEDETARLYDEFVASFQADNTLGSKTFVRGGTINPNDKVKLEPEGAPFQKHREEEEAKKKRVEDETARLYEEFVASFQEDNTPGSNMINPNDKVKPEPEDGVSVPKRAEDETARLYDEFVASFQGTLLGRIR